MQKKSERKGMKIDRILLGLIIIMIIAGVIIFKKPAVTGRAVQGSEAIFSENLNMQVNESGTYEWQVKNPGSIKSLKASGSVSANGTARVYIEKNGTRQLIFDSAKQLFDIDIHVLPEYKRVFQGDEVLLELRLFNLRGFGAGNVNVKYYIKDSKENVIAVEEEKIFVETQAKFVRKLVMPLEIKPGTYIAFVEVFTDVIAGSGSDTFEVIGHEAPSYQQLRYYIIGVAAVVAMLIIAILTIYGHGVIKKKKQIAELKEKAPLERGEKLERELKALEDAYKSGFISKESYEKERKRIEERLEVLKK
ncbi:hypothetical protein J4480_02285 [Candidatus Woesearchaeota archaeon]|nr:hypothetical protein [Candidatus Woesearchaeota archaeon]